MKACIYLPHLLFICSMKADFLAVCATIDQLHVYTMYICTTCIWQNVEVSCREKLLQWYRKSNLDVMQHYPITFRGHSPSPCKRVQHLISLLKEGWVLFQVQQASSNLDTIGSTTAYPEYRSLSIFESCNIFPVGMEMCTRAVEHYKAIFQSSPFLYAGKKSQPVASTMHTNAIIMYTYQWYWMYCTSSFNHSLHKAISFTEGILKVETVFLKMSAS